jgi:hypothetical protein
LISIYYIILKMIESKWNYNNDDRSVIVREEKQNMCRRIDMSCRMFMKDKLKIKSILIQINLQSWKGLMIRLLSSYRYEYVVFLSYNARTMKHSLRLNLIRFVFVKQTFYFRNMILVEINFNLNCLSSFYVQL